MLQAKIIADSSFEGERLTTFEVEFHRFILPELNTHRVFSRNYQSSRAVPVKSLIEQVRDNPAIPVHWGKNQPGMVADKELSGLDLDSAMSRWNGAAEDAAYHADLLNKDGAHKQIVNRLLEPFMWTRGVITATEDGFNSFFKLRCHPAAQPEIQALAYLMKDAFDASTPIELKPGEWHLPYIEWNVDCDGQYFTGDDITTLEEAIKVSTSCVAQVSYRKLDDSVEKARKIYDMLNLPAKGLFSKNPPHFSPAEHCAMALADDIAIDMFSDGYSESDIGGNFQSAGFYQYRKMLERGFENHFIG